MQRTLVMVILATACPLWATSVKVHGYITNLVSPGAFSIAEYHVTHDAGLTFDLDKGDYPDATFRPDDLRVGTELEIQGDFNDSTHELRATSIKVFFNDNLRVKRSAVIEHATVLVRDTTGWSGIIHADGQTIRIDGQTRFTLKEDQTNQLTPGLSITYEGRRDRDGSILASRLEIFPNAASRSELRMWREITPKLSSSGEISIQGVKYKLVPDAEAQSYVQRVGAKLVPAFYRQDLSGGAARQIPFQFYLIENPDFNAHAFPNGTVLVNSGVFRVLTSEGQFAAVLGHEIAHATHEHAARDQQSQKKSGGAALLRGIGFAGSKGELLNNTYSHSLENQADRMSLEYMVNAGYDPREAPEVWWQVARSATPSDAGSTWSSKDDSTSRRSYLLSELTNNYSSADFHSYVRNREEFDRLAERFGNTAIAKRLVAPPAPDASSSVRPGYQRTLQNSVASPAQQAYSGNAVTLISDPAGSDVILNGRIIGKTPLTLPTGNVGLPFIITIQKAGYRGWTGQLVSVPGRTSLRIDLLPAQ